MRSDKDLRMINKEEFKEICEYLKNRTNNFSEINTELLQENPQYLFVIRLALGLSQLELGKLLDKDKYGIMKQWVRHFESARQNFKYSKTLPKCVDVINERLSNGRRLNDYNDILILWRRSQNAIKKWYYKYPEPKFKLKRIAEMEKEDFINYFNLLSRETDNFTKFDPIKLIETPVFITIFRIILGLNLYQLCDLLKMQTRRIRKYERFEERMMPETAEKIMKVFEEQFKNKNLTGNVSLEYSIQQFERLSPFDEIELKIKKLFEESGFQVYHNDHIVPKCYPLCAKIHANIQSIKKELNIDFIIPSTEKPLIAIEITKFSDVRRKDVVHRIAYLDHRFQLLKLKYKEISAFLIIECTKNQEDLIKRTIKREVVNADFCLVNETEKLVSIIQDILSRNFVTAV